MRSPGLGVGAAGQRAIQVDLCVAVAWVLAPLLASIWANTGLPYGTAIMPSPVRGVVGTE